MRVRRSRRGLTVRAIGGTHVVLLAMHMDEALCPGHMGFGIHRTDHTEGEAYWLKGIKTFAETDPGLRAGSTYGTSQHPIQGFTWSDFTAKAGHRYTYRVVAMKGTPAALKAFREVSVEVHTESDAEHGHDVYFNRGAAASQEYSRRFGRLASLENAPDTDPRWAWLSRGAFEGILAFIAQARDAGYGLRVAAYEFRLEPFAAALREARARGVDVQIVYDGNPNQPDRKGHVFPRDDNRATAAGAGVQALCRERVTRADVKSPPISHHKFVVLLRRRKPVAVLTGSTNFSRGGVFGQSNVVHVVENAAVAAKYLRCWELIAGNTAHRELEAGLAALNEVPEALPRTGTSCIFSPQPSLAALHWYARLARESRGAVFMTFAFGMNELFRDAYRNGAAPLRYALMEDLLAPGIRSAAREQAQAEMTALRRLTENRFAVGNRIKSNAFDRWVAEKLSGLNTHVQFIHTKFLLADPLGADPIVVSGSANFSKASTDSNDENMLVIRGDRRVADIYLGEYMRLWNHYAFREWLAARSNSRALAFNHLDTTDKWWRRYFGDTVQSRQRAYFAGVAA